MKTVNESEKTTNILLGMPIDKLLNEEARNVVEKKDIKRFKNIDSLVKRYFSKQIVRCMFGKLAQFNKLLAEFLAWFEWGGEVVKWEEVELIVKGWETIMDLNRFILDSEITPKAHQEIIKTANGENIVDLLHKEKKIKAAEIYDALKLDPTIELSGELYTLENIGIIAMEFEGKELILSLTKLGEEVYLDYIKPKTEISQLLSTAFNELEKSELQKAEKTLLRAIETDPDNPFSFFLLGIVSLEKGDLSKAGDLLVKAVKSGMDKEKTFLYFSNLEKMRKLDFLKDSLFVLNTQSDEISAKIRPSLRILGMLNEYIGKTSRANQLYEYSKKEK
jgi:hypothetical protein